MLVIVKKDYVDLQAGKTLRKAGQLLDYKSEKRANELLAKGFVRRVEIQEVEETEEVKDTKKVEETKEEVRKRPTKK
mgnify:CR=1 FL=1